MSYLVRHTLHQSPNVSATPITAMGCRQCLPLSFVQLKQCPKPHWRNVIADMFGPSHVEKPRVKIFWYQNSWNLESLISFWGSLLYKKSLKFEQKQKTNEKELAWKFVPFFCWLWLLLNFKGILAAKKLNGLTQKLILFHDNCIKFDVSFLTDLAYCVACNVMQYCISSFNVLHSSTYYYILTSFYT